jgi:hypothetical protein
LALSDRSTISTEGHDSALANAGETVALKPLTSEVLNDSGANERTAVIEA